MENRCSRLDFIAGLSSMLIGLNGLRTGESPLGYVERKVRQLTGTSARLGSELFDTNNVNHDLAIGGATYAVGSSRLNRRQALILALAAAVASDAVL